jgi:transcriptional regulator with XRE-family HTH domain
MSARAQAEANRPYAHAVRSARERAGMSQSEFARALTQEGAPASIDQVYRWERAIAVVPAYLLPAAQRVVMFGVARKLREERRAAASAGPVEQVG